MTMLSLFFIALLRFTDWSITDLVTLSRQHKPLYLFHGFTNLKQVIQMISIWYRVSNLLRWSINQQQCNELIYYLCSSLIVQMPSVMLHGVCVMCCTMIHCLQEKRERCILEEWLVCREVAGIYCAEQQLGRQPPLVKQMSEEWMDRYRHLSQAMSAAGMGRKRRGRRGTTHISSEEELDEDRIC